LQNALQVNKILLPNTYANTHKHIKKGYSA